LPTVHLLVPNTTNPYLNNLTFRQALAYGIDRPLILEQLLLGGSELAGCRILSGPFPGATAQTDAVAYAYDEQIESRPYERRQAATYVILAERQIEAAAKRANQQPPKRSAFVLAHPTGEVPRIACESIAQQLASCGIEIQLRQFPPGVTDDPQRQYDLLYVEAAVWEPLVDARRLLGPDGASGSTGAHINLALRQLDAATTWTEARQRLYDLHRTVFDDVTVIPLWQIMNYFARNKSLRGVGQRPLTLYQNVEAWQLVY
jgi:ABC-type transport system substrate-binding protein